MVQAIYSNKKGIYKNLYLEIDSENKKKKTAEASYSRRPKGIYRDLYKHITEFKGNEDEYVNSYHVSFLQSLQNFLNSWLSKMSYFFSSAGSSLKILMLACLIAKKPVNNYIDNNVTYQNQGYYNDRQS